MLTKSMNKRKKNNILGNLNTIKCFKSSESNFIEKFLQPQLQYPYRGFSSNIT